MERARPEKKQTPLKVKMGFIKLGKSQPSPRIRALDLNNWEFLSLHGKNKYLFIHFQFGEHINSGGPLIKSNSKIFIKIVEIKLSFPKFTIFISMFTIYI